MEIMTEKELVDEWNHLSWLLSEEISDLEVEKDEWQTSEDLLKVQNKGEQIVKITKRMCQINRELSELSWSKE